MGHSYTADKMTEEIFRHDGYAFEFEACVVSAEGELVELDMTAFYPGGGGQVCDTGTIRGCRVTEAFYKNGNIVHKVPKHDLKVGDKVWCSVDWDRRYDLMQGHTGEHLLFCSLKKQDPELEITKIFISPESKYVIVNRDLSWNSISAALEFANRAIRDNLSVTKSMMSRDDPELEKVRIKLDRISEEEISVVSIGDIDLSACSGVHVMETSELEMIFVDRKVSAGKDGFAIHFKIGDAAKDAAMNLACTCLETAEKADSKPEDLVKAVSNMKHEISLSREASKNITKQQIASLVPEKIEDLELYTESFVNADRNMLTDGLESVKNKGAVGVFVSVGDTVSVMIASGDGRIDCKAMLSDVMQEFSGRGGGKPDFAQGGIPDRSVADMIIPSFRKRIEKKIKS